MQYVNRVDRIIKVMSGDIIQNNDWLYMRGLNGESESLWSFFKDKVPIRANVSGKPNLSEWCQRVYELLPNDTKIRKKRSSTFCSCKTAHRLGEPLALMVCSMEKWLNRNENVVIKKMKNDNPNWSIRA